MKLLLKILLFGLIALLLLGVAGYLAMDKLVGRAIEEGGTYATGVETTLGGVDLGLFSGSMTLDAFGLDNPDGYREEPFLTMGKATVDVDTASLLSNEIEIDTIQLDGLELNIEKIAKGTNYGEILDHIAGLSASEPAGQSAPSEGQGQTKALHVKRIVLNDLTASLHLDTKLLEGSSSVTIPVIELNDVRSNGSPTEIVGQLTSQIIEAIMQETMKAGADIFPSELLADMGGKLQVLSGELESSAKDLLENAGTQLEEQGEELQKRADDVKTQAEDAAKDVKETLGGLKDAFKKKKDDG